MGVFNNFILFIIFLPVSLIQERYLCYLYPSFYLQFCSKQAFLFLNCASLHFPSRNMLKLLLPSETRASTSLTKAKTTYMLYKYTNGLPPLHTTLLIALLCLHSLSNFKSLRTELPKKTFVTFISLCPSLPFNLKLQIPLLSNFSSFFLKS